MTGFAAGEVSFTARRYVQAGILSVWGSVALAFVGSGRIASYLHPSFHLWTAVCGVVLLLMAAALLFVPAEDEDCADEACGGSHGPRTVVSVGLAALFLVVPLLVSVAVSPSQFGAVAVMNRGLAESIVDLPGLQIPYSEPALPTLDGMPAHDATMPGSEAFPPMDFMYRNDDGRIVTSTVDLLYAAHEPQMRRDFENQEIEVIGQFFPAKRNNPMGDRFMLVRMFILCCAADARPVAIAVRAPDKETFPDMSWVKVEGRVTFPMEGGKRVPLIDATSVAPTDQPAETFIY